MGVNSFPIFACLSLCAAVLKVVCWVKYKNKIAVLSWSFFALFYCVLFINILEFFSFFVELSVYAYLLLKLYYLLIIVAFFSMGVMCLQVTDRYRFYLVCFLLILTVVNIVNILHPEMAILGVEKIGYILTRVEGETYWFFQLSLAAYVFVVVFELLYGVFRPKTELIRLKSKSLLVALSPILFCALFVISFMRMGYPISGVIFGSFASLLFVCSLFITEMQFLGDEKARLDPLFRFLSLFPGTKEYNRLARIRGVVSNPGVLSHNEQSQFFEAYIISQALSEAAGNKTEAAKELGISRATLTRKTKRFNL